VNEPPSQVRRGRRSPVLQTCSLTRRRASRSTAAELAGAPPPTTMTGVPQSQSPVRPAKVSGRTSCSAAAAPPPPSVRASRSTAAKPPPGEPKCRRRYSNCCCCCLPRRLLLLQCGAIRRSVNRGNQFKPQQEEQWGVDEIWHAGGKVGITDTATTIAALDQNQNSRQRPKWPTDWTQKCSRPHLCAKQSFPYLETTIETPRSFRLLRTWQVDELQRRCGWNDLVSQHRIEWLRAAPLLRTTADHIKSTKAARTIQRTSRESAQKCVDRICLATITKWKGKAASTAPRRAPTRMGYANTIVLFGPVHVPPLHVAWEPA